MTRILFIERPRFVGGSIIALYRLVAHLNRSRFEPFLLLHGPNPYGEHFAAIGVPVITLADEVTESRATGRQPVQRDIAATLGKYSQAAAAAYRASKFTYTFLTQEMPLALRIRRIIKSERIDLVHANNSLPTNRPGVLAARWARVPVISHHRTFVQVNAVDRWLARGLAAHVHVSRALSEHHVTQGFPMHNAQVIYDGVDFAPSASLAEVQSVRQDLGVAPDQLAVGLVGRLDWWKGHDIFVQAIGLLADRMPNVRALLIGDVDDTAINQRYAAGVHRLVDELQLNDRIIFAGYRRDMPEVMSALDLVVHCSTEPEPFGLVIIEALSADRPVVATAAGGPLEIITNGVHGLLVPPGDAEALAEAIAFLLQHPSQARDMAKAGHERVKRMFSLERQADVMQVFYDKILERSRGTTGEEWR